MGHGYYGSSGYLMNGLTLTLSSRTLCAYMGSNVCIGNPDGLDLTIRHLMCNLWHDELDKNFANLIDLRWSQCRVQECWQHGRLKHTVRPTNAHQEYL